jgi:DNA-binding FadR family transcriptional regulator
METTQLFRSVGKSRLSDDIATQIETAIREGRLIPGQALPSERELSNTFRVSRPIIREALRMLEIQGFVSIQQGCCTLIKDPETDIFRQPISQWLEKNMTLLSEFYEARLAVEPACAALASQHATDRQLQILYANLQDSERIAGSGENLAALVGLDIDFHGEIARMSANSLLVKLMDTLTVPETDVRKVVLRIPGHLPSTLEGHRQIYAAIAAGDSQAARQAMITALNQPFVAIEKYLQQNNLKV